MNDDSSLRLPEEISIQNVNEWRATLLEVLQNNSAVNIDAADLSRIDTAGLQLLTVFVTEMISAGKTLQWESSSRMLVTTARQLGLAKKLLLGE